MSKRLLFAIVLFVGCSATLLTTAIFWKPQQQNPIEASATLLPSPEILFVRVAAVYEGMVDNRYYMTEEALHVSAKSFLGQPVLMGHEWRDPRACVGLVISSRVRYDEELEAHYIEMDFMIRDQDAIARIKKQLFHKLSIGFSLEHMVCPLDGLDMMLCPHRAGEYYNVRGKRVLARGIVYDLSGLEVSFVNVPASAPARVLDWSHDLQSLSERN